MRRILLILACVMAMPVFSQNAGIDVLQSVHVHRDQKLDPTFKFITHTTDPVAIAAPIAVLATGLLRKDSSLTYKGVYMVESIVVASLISTALKYSIKRNRPFEDYAFIDPQVSAAEKRSFPSGHTSAAFATATSLSIVFPKWYVIAPSFLWAGAVGYSRMHLGVHYPGDVLAGAAIGAGTSIATHFVNKKIQEKKGRKNLYIDLW